MYSQENAIQIIKQLMKEHIDIELQVEDSGAVWNKNPELMTPLQWKHIGYVSALACAFNIIKLSI